MHLYKVCVNPLLNIPKDKRLGFRLGTVYIGNPTVAGDVAYLSRLRHELQLMFGAPCSFSASSRYQTDISNKDCCCHAHWQAF